MNTTHLKFYHGTSARAAAAILADGALDPFGRLRAREFVREVWPVILGSAGSFYKTANLFVQAGSEYYASAPVALQNVCNGNDKSTFSYGEFYVSLGLEKAARYAIRSRSGSELLLFIAEAIKVIRMLGGNPIDRLLASYPDLMTQLEEPFYPLNVKKSSGWVSRRQQCYPRRRRTP